MGSAQSTPKVPESNPPKNISSVFTIFDYVNGGKNPRGGGIGGPNELKLLWLHSEKRKADAETILEASIYRERCSSRWPHDFVLLKTESYYWTIEKSCNFLEIALGKYENMDLINEKMVPYEVLSWKKGGKATIVDLFRWLHEGEELTKVHRWFSEEAGCRGFAKRIFKKYCNTVI